MTKCIWTKNENLGRITLNSFVSVRWSSWTRIVFNHYLLFVRTYTTWYSFLPAVCVGKHQTLQNFHEKLWQFSDIVIIFTNSYLFNPVSMKQINESRWTLTTEIRRINVARKLCTEWTMINDSVRVMITIIWLQGLNQK